jgi:beta-glucosidase
MSLEEKVSLLTGQDHWFSRANKRLGIPALCFADGPLGVRKQAAASDHLGLNPGLPATCFPAPATIANSWDEALAENVGEHLGCEAAALGVNVLLGPGLNIKRSPLCGRNFEYFSEDPYLSGKMAAAYIRGIQRNGVAACPKHLAANSQELRRMASDSIVDERTLREIYLTGFEIAVKEGEPLSIMSAYNKINGVYANENEWLLQKLLRDDWGFRGFVVTDWGGSNDHVLGVKAGSHLEMPATDHNGDRELTSAIISGRLNEAVVARRAEEYLGALFSIGTAGKSTAGAPDCAKHHAFARKAAAESIVLLKNEEGILPLRPEAKVAVIGEFAAKPRYQGSGSSLVNTVQLDTTLGCIGDSGITLMGYEPGYDRGGLPDDEKLDAACRLAAKGDTVLLYLGLDETLESEGVDRAHMRLHQNQTDLLKAVNGVNQNVIVVLSCGSPVEMPWLDYCKGLVHGYLGGEAGAGAMLDVLAGKVCPCGKLAESYPIAYEDTPAYHYYPGKEYTAEYREGLYVGYRYYDTADVPVRFPFGFGLSYTTFAYDDLEVTKEEVRITVKNTGSVYGAEIVQLYISKPDAVIFRPEKELKGFAKVWLEPGQSERISIPLDNTAFRYFDTSTGGFEIETGEYRIMLGASSRDIRLAASVWTAGTAAPNPYSAASPYRSGKVQQVSDAEFEELLGRPLPESAFDPAAPLGRNDTISQMQYAKSRLARFLYRCIARLRKKAEAQGKLDINILFICNMPFRAIAKLTGGKVDMAMVDALLDIVNGHLMRGVRRLMIARARMRKANRAFEKKLREQRNETEADMREAG